MGCRYCENASNVQGKQASLKNAKISKKSQNFDKCTNPVFRYFAVNKGHSICSVHDYALKDGVHSLLCVALGNINPGS